MKFEDLTPREACILRRYYGNHDHLDNDIENTSPEQLKRIVAMYDSPCICPPNGTDEGCPHCIPF